MTEDIALNEDLLALEKSLKLRLQPIHPDQRSGSSYCCEFYYNRCWIGCWFNYFSDWSNFCGREELTGLCPSENK
jgi:hypothetical protein